MAVLLNVLVALYNSAYSQITDNALDEYLALFAMKTTQFVRAPDANVYIPPLNIVEWLILPLEFVLSRRRYEQVNDIVMGVLYSPLLMISAAIEVREARKVTANRSHGQADDDEVQEWEQMADECDFEADGWAQRVKQTCPDIDEDESAEMRNLCKDVAEIKAHTSQHGT